VIQKDGLQPKLTPVI